MSMFDIALDYQRERERFPKLKHLNYPELLMARQLAAGDTSVEAGVRLGLNGEAAEALRRQLLRKLGLDTDAQLASLVEASVPQPEVAYVDDFRLSYFRPTARASDGDVVFAD